jgi:hypothetical protein
MRSKPLGWWALGVCVGSVLVATLSRGSQSPDSSLQAATTQPDPSQQISTLSDRIQALEASQRQSDGMVYLGAKINELSNEAQIDVNQDGYSSVQTNVGRLLLKCVKVEPHLDGYRLTLEIGNPTTATISGGTLHVQYGPQAPAIAQGEDAVDRYEAWQRTLKSADFTLTDQLDAGHWTPVSIAISPASANDLRCLIVSLKLDSISLPERTNPQ